MPQKSAPHRVTRRWVLTDLFVLAAWTALLAAWFWDLVVCQNTLFYFDVTEINLPYRDFVATEMQAGRLSRWHPGLYGGFPLYSESQAGYFHPSKLLYLIPGLPTWAAFGFDTTASIWLLGIFTYGWLRTRFSAAPSACGALVFTLGGYTWAHVVHTSMLNALVSVPLVLWGFEAAVARGRRLGLIAASVALALQVYAGHLQDAVMTGMLVGLLAVWHILARPDWVERQAILRRAALLGTLAVLVSAPQWLPSLELIGRSTRAKGLTHSEITFGSWHPELIPSLFLPEAFGSRAHGTDWLDSAYPYHEMGCSFGIIALLLALIGLHDLRDRWVASWAAIGLVAILFMLGRFTYLYDLVPQIPLLGGMRIPARFGMWLVLAVAALATEGVERLRLGCLIRWRTVAIIWLMLIAIALTIAIIAYARPLFAPPPDTPTQADFNRETQTAAAWWTWMTLLHRELLPGLLRLAALALATWLVLAAIARAPARNGGTRRALLFSSLVALVCVELLWPQRNNLPRVEPRYWDEAPATAKTILADRNHQRVFGYPNVTTAPRDYAQVPVDFFPIRDWLSWSLPPVFGLPSAGGVSPLVPERMVEFTNKSQTMARRDLEGTTHVLGDRLDPADFERVFPVGRVWIGTNPRALPRARLAGRPIYAETPQKAAEALSYLKREDTDRLIVEDPARPLSPETRVEGTAVIMVDLPEHLVVETLSPGQAYLVLADSFDPGWSATVDGSPVPIHPAYLAFRAVYLPAGAHSVEFRYEPAGFRSGLLTGAIGVLACLAVLAWRARTPWTAVALCGESPRSLFLLVTVLHLVLAIVLASILAIDPNTGVSIQPRWLFSWHSYP
jgi:hypothetical protein